MKRKLVPSKFKRNGGSGEPGEAYAPPDFGRREGDAGQRRQTALLLVHSDFQTLPCAIPASSILILLVFKYLKPALTLWVV